MRKLLSLFAAVLLFVANSFAQIRVIKGKVTDATGSPVPYVSVSVKGTKTAVAADENGNFTIKAKTGDMLNISAVGVQSQQFKVTEGSDFNISVKRMDANLSEVVVTTALGVKRQARELGYATEKVNSQELTEAKNPNIASSLAAKVSGLRINLVNNSVKPDTRIVLRGNRSFLGNNQPLLVVDDVQLDVSYLGSLNPDDVDNVTVLKGASASALYGSAASNGVIIITTKRGAKGKPKVTVSSTLNVESVAYMPDFQNEFGQYGGENDPNAYPGIVALPSNPYIYYVPYENQSYGPRFNGQRVPLGAPIRIYRPDGSFYIQQDSINYSALPDAKRKFFNHGLSAINNVSYSAGDAKSSFFMSFQDVNTTGIVPNDQSRRNTIRINGARESGIFRAEYNLGYSLTHTNTTPGSGVPFTWGTTPYVGGYGAGTGGSYFQNRPLYWTIINTPPDIDLRRYRNWRTDPFASPDGYFNAYYGNPWWQIDQTRLDERSNNLIGNLSLSLKPFEWLNLTYKAGIARNDYSNKYTQAGYTFAPWAIADTLGSGNIPSGVKKLSPSEGDAISYNQRLTSEFLASAHKTFGNFDFRLIGGTQLIDNTMRLFSGSANALVIPDFYNISNRVGNPTVSEYKEETRVLGVFGDLTVGYKNFAFIHGSLRNDWNSLLSASNRSYLYPAVDGSLVFTDAIKALKNNNVLNFGKVHVAYSQTAQVSIGAYALQNTFNSGSGFPFGSVAGYTVNGAYANPNIKPEISNNTEAGFELGFFKSKVNLTATYYNTLTKNQTIPIGISSTTGYTTAYVNSGQMRNQGIELDLKFAPILQTKSGFRWNVGANFSYNKNTVVDAGSQYGLSQVTIGNPFANSNAVPVASVAQVGLPYGQIQTNDWLRDPQGRIIVDPNTGYPSLDPKLKLFGTANAPTAVGINTTLSYKGFTLYANVDGRFGGVIMNGLGPSLDFTGVSAYSASFGRQPFVIPNSSVLVGGKYVPNTNVVTQDGNNLFWANVWNTAGSNYVSSADFWKLREISLTYNFPKKLLESLKVVNDLSLSVVGRNLLVFRAKGNVWSDPEFANTSGNAVGNTDINQLPPTKFYGFNLTVTF
ncbi:MAG: SusC/RagA family TonB-linked outer membrane protein [Bacteroidota bacterium]|nr:SusC/RagA family TonB-linked outer membrane protein [Bacteroidota bacterium]